MKDNPWPIYFELNPGETATVACDSANGVVERSIKLISVEHAWQPDFWSDGNTAKEIIESALVKVEVAGEPFEIIARPYQSPINANGLRLYVEATREWAHKALYLAMPDVVGAVRFAAVAAGESWGPAQLRFPILNYRWHSSSYNNTWLQIVPYNSLYYHRGEDFGAIPDLLEVAAPLDAIIAKTPLPKGDGASNHLCLKSANDHEIILAHMNIEHISQHLRVGATVKAGEILGRTGCTWSGRRSQYNDPHLHVGFMQPCARLAPNLAARPLDEKPFMSISPFPSLVEAYFRDYPDALLPIAGGYRFAIPGLPIKLDAIRSIARPGRKIIGYTWRLHDASQVEAPTTEITINQPGLYSEMLEVRVDDGSVDYDFLQVRVYNPKHEREIASGWIHSYPSRGSRPGDAVIFDNRLSKVKNTMIDFGDGSPAIEFGERAQHQYQKSGVFIVSATAKGPFDEPVTVKLRVIVER